LISQMWLLLNSDTKTQNSEVATVVPIGARRELTAFKSQLRQEWHDSVRRKHVNCT